VALIAEDEAGEPGDNLLMAARADHPPLVEEALLTREDDPNALCALTHTHAFHILRLACGWHRQQPLLLLKESTISLL
jgi:hypothetical protein